MLNNTSLNNIWHKKETSENYKSILSKIQKKKLTKIGGILM